jgi:hypothetical protein
MTKHQFMRIGVWLIGLALLSTALGCGKGTSNHGDVSGEVTLDGQPLAIGAIIFTPIEGAKGTVTGGDIKNGRYELTGPAGPAIGWNRVQIRGMKKTGKMVQKPYSPKGEMTEEMVSIVPLQYNSDSKLKFEIKPGKNTANFPIQSK